MTKTPLKIGIAACALGAANAFAFYGTEIENYRVNPWLDRPADTGKATSRPGKATSRPGEATSPASGPTRTGSEAYRPGSEPGTVTTESAIERFWHEADRASRFGGN